MPNPPRDKPRSKITSDSLCSQFYQLNQIDYIIFNEYCYKLDWENYNSKVAYRRERMRVIQNNVTSLRNELEWRWSGPDIGPNELPTLESSLAQARIDYLNALEKCNIVDEDEKICGEYFTSSKEYKIFYRRFIHNGKLYYRDDDNDLWSYLNSCRGRLKDDGETIEGCGCTNCSCENTEDEAEDEAEADDDEYYDAEDDDEDEDEDDDDEDDSQE